MITVHHLNNSRSQRILWMLEELNLEYESKDFQDQVSHMTKTVGLIFSCLLLHLQGAVLRNPSDTCRN